MVRRFGETHLEEGCIIEGVKLAVTTDVDMEECEPVRTVSREGHESKFLRGFHPGAKHARSEA